MTTQDLDSEERACSNDTGLEFEQLDLNPSDNETYYSEEQDMEIHGVEL